MRTRSGHWPASLLAAVACVVALSASPARAAFPGANGAVVFASTMGGNSDIYALSLDGSAPRGITSSPLREQQPAVSPDGLRIAYKTVTTSPRDEEAWITGFDGTGGRQLTDTPGSLRFSTQPAWAPDGGRLLVRSNRDAGHYDVWSVRASDGGDPVQLTQDAADDRYPTLSPDGTRIAFRSDRGGDPDIWVMGADGSNPVDLTAATGRWESAPAWSPDGRRLAFERVGLPGDPDTDATVAATDEIWTMAADGSDQRRLTDNAAHDEGPAWSPDGTQIVFTSAREEPNGDIWLMGTDGTQQRRLFGTAAIEESPDWQALALPPPVAPKPPPVPPSPSISPATAGAPIGRLTAVSRARHYAKRTLKGTHITVRCIRLSRTSFSCRLRYTRSHRRRTATVKVYRYRGVIRVVRR